MKFPKCPKDQTHEWHGSTQTLYEKAEGTMRKRAILCSDCKAVYVLFKEGYKPEEIKEAFVTYQRTDAKSIPFKRSA